MKYIIDIDGVIGNTRVIRDYSRKNLMSIGVNQEYIDKINELYNYNNRIVLFTSRPLMSKAFTIAWLRKHKVQFHEIYFDKPEGDVYVDDRMITLNKFLKL